MGSSDIRTHHIDPGKFKNDCSKCGQKAPIEHIFWDCLADPPPEELQKLVGSKKWETLLAISAPDVQVLPQKEPKRSHSNSGPSGGVADPITL
ncbi:hypothetical protein MTO96_040601 [Rhipicephalus appendiculatus]